MVLLAGQVKQEYWWRCLLILVGKEWTGFVVEVIVKYLQNAKSAAWMKITAKERRTQNETQFDLQPELGAPKSQANSLSLSAGSSTSYISYSCIGDRFSVPGSAKCFLPGVDELVLDESV